MLGGNSMGAARNDQLAKQEELLNHVFPHGALSYEYLDWLYRKSPDGPNVASDYIESGKLLGHYAIIPQRWNYLKTTRQLALSLNTAVHEEARGKGLFVKLAEETYADAKNHGIQAIIGVANANSTPGFLRRLGFTLLSPLPVVMGMALPIRSSATASHVIDAEFLASKRFNLIANRLQTTRSHGAAQEWTIEKLRWRLASPRTRYALHRHESGILITTMAATQLGVRIVVVLKFLPSRDVNRMDVTKLLRRAAAYHKSPFFIYSGFNECAPIKGIILPRRLLPSPLNLIYRKLDQVMPEACDLHIDAFEFLDFDAY